MGDLIVAELRTVIPDTVELVRAGIRLSAALFVGALIGYQREKIGKAAGLRTHMIVAMGTALFVIVSIQYGMQDDAASRVIQGLATGIGFLGAGVILKHEEDQRIRGLTTAAGIWMTAAASVAIGLGHVGLGLISGVLTWVVLTVFQNIGPKAANIEDKKTAA